MFTTLSSETDVELGEMDVAELGEMVVIDKQPRPMQIQPL